MYKCFADTFVVYAYVVLVPQFITRLTYKLNSSKAARAQKEVFKRHFFSHRMIFELFRLICNIQIKHSATTHLSALDSESSFFTQEFLKCLKSSSILSILRPLVAFVIFFNNQTSKRLIMAENLPTKSLH